MGFKCHRHSDARQQLLVFFEFDTCSPRSRTLSATEKRCLVALLWRFRGGAAALTPPPTGRFLPLRPSPLRRLSSSLLSRLPLSPASEDAPDKEKFTTEKEKGSHSALIAKKNLSFVLLSELSPLFKKTIFVVFASLSHVIIPFFLLIPGEKPPPTMILFYLRCRQLLASFSF